jgi:hypothetical protein
MVGLTRGQQLGVDIAIYCAEHKISYREFADREGIHPRQMRGIMRGYWMNNVTDARIEYGIGRVTTERFVHYMTLCKKNMKYAHVVERHRKENR